MEWWWEQFDAVIRAFATVARRSLAPWHEHGPARPIGVIDVGCGAGTVAFAFDELAEGNVTLRYVGVDHHQPTLDLCDKMVGPRLNAGPGDLHLTSSITAAVDHAITGWPPVSRTFVTCSYLLNQDSFTDQALRSVVADLARLVRHQGRTWFIVSDAAGLGWKTRPRLRKLRGHLEAASLTTDAYQEHFDPYTMRFPDLDGEQFRREYSRSVEGYVFAAVPAGVR